MELSVPLPFSPTMPARPLPSTSVAGSTRDLIKYMLLVGQLLYVLIMVHSHTAIASTSHAPSLADDLFNSNSPLPDAMDITETGAAPSIAPLIALDGPCAQHVHSMMEPAGDIVLEGVYIYTLEFTTEHPQITRKGV